MTFRQAVHGKKLMHEKKLVPPNKPNFTYKAWVAKFKEIENPTYDDNMLFFSGIVFFKIFEKIRENLNNLNEKIPRCTNEDIIRAHCAISNHNLITLDEKMKSSVPEVLNLNIPENFDCMGSNISIPPQDIADSIVDSIHHAINVRLTELKTKNNSKENMDIYEFLKMNIVYSELYSSFENYWQGILWGGYILETRGKDIVIKQLDNANNISHHVSLNRKMKLAISSAAFGSFKINEDDEILTYTNGSIKVRNINLLTHANRMLYYSFIHSSEQAEITYPERIIKGDITGETFSISDVINVFINLAVLSREVYSSLSKINGLSLEDILELCPDFSTYEVCINLSKVTGLRFDKVGEILKFLTFKSGKDNLWSQPVISLRNKKLTILLSSTTSPNMERIIGYWVKQAFHNDDVAKKGTTYEKLLLSAVNDRLSKNSIFLDHEKAISHTFSLEEYSEQIDCAFRFGNVVVVCEAKCIVTVDSEISKHNTIKALNHAAKQIIRKSAFVKENIQDFFKSTEWDFDKNSEYEVISVIVNSNKSFVGGSFKGIPVVDELILANFFRKGRSALLTDTSGKDVLWFNIYSNLEEAQSAFKSYLDTPPQIALDSRYLEKITRNSFEEYLNIGTNIIVENITFRKYTVNDIINAKYIFPLEKTKNYDLKIKNLDILI